MTTLQSVRCFGIVLLWACCCSALLSVENGAKLIADQTADFGLVLPDEGLDAYAILGMPFNACMPIEPPKQSTVQTWAALVERGGCSFVDKALNAQRAGARAVIVMNNVPNQKLIVMRAERGEEGWAMRVNIAAVFISNEDGLVLQSMLQDKYPDPVAISLYPDDTYPDFRTLIARVAYVLVPGIILIMGLTVLGLYMINLRRRTLRTSDVARRVDMVTAKCRLVRYPASTQWLKSNSTCPICLDDFENGAKVRVLPCNHGYHVKCIDTWFGTQNTTCCVCKRDVLSAPTERTPLLADAGEVV
eukprot:Colp12_sorted_trinity150504_noHs@25900